MVDERKRENERERERETFFMGDASSARPYGKHRERERENGHKMVKIFYFRLIAKHIFYG